MSIVENMDAPAPRRRRNGEQTRKALLQATKTLIAKNDYYSITLDQVSEKVGVSKSSILWHFSSKEGLLTEAILDLFDEMEQAIMPRKTCFTNLNDRVAHLLESVAAYFTNNPEAKGIVLSLIFNSRTPARIRKRIVEHLRGDKRKVIAFLSSEQETVSEAAAASIIALVHGCYVQWYLDGYPDDLHQRLLDMYHGTAAFNR